MVVKSPSDDSFQLVIADLHRRTSFGGLVLE